MSDKWLTIQRRKVTDVFIRFDLYGRKDKYSREDMDKLIKEYNAKEENQNYYILIDDKNMEDLAEAVGRSYSFKNITEILETIKEDINSLKCYFDDVQSGINTLEESLKHEKNF